MAKFLRRDLEDIQEMRILCTHHFVIWNDLEPILTRLSKTKWQKKQDWTKLEFAIEQMDANLSFFQRIKSELMSFSDTDFEKFFLHFRSYPNPFAFSIFVECFGSSNSTLEELYKMNIQLQASLSHQNYDRKEKIKEIFKYCFEYNPNLKFDGFYFVIGFIYKNKKDLNRKWESMKNNLAKN